ncbi:MAG: undecaprenyl/decaprenyl-phosphate alpha-N-acetylglucosaminyl 1-phosphate transferase [Defluviitaleaceae bacterium]|nr:undecaprenyl/decaprenyl-phosphate alpha-N-acetylglucosaminyl 1-phosphate transferase [Defluviitaleaceae bacterium]
MVQYLLAFAVVFFISLALMPFVARLAHRFDFTDKPTERKKHNLPIPLTGGLVMFVAFSVGFFMFAIGFDTSLLFIFGGAAMIVLVGLVDDYSKTKEREFPVWPRLLVHFAAAAVAFAGNVRFTGFFNFFTGYYIYLPVGLQFALTVLWIMGLVTVFNFMDGLDGLSGLLALVAGSTFFIVAIYMNQPESAFLSLILVAAICGFLRFNLPPAKVYMGDSGAYLLGYMLAAISLQGAFKQATVVSLAIPMLAMGVPIFDGVLVVVRRLLARKPAHVADSTNITHLHFRLMKSGMKPGRAVAIIFLLSLCLNVASVILMLMF